MTYTIHTCLDKFISFTFVVIACLLAYLEHTIHLVFILHTHWVAFLTTLDLHVQFPRAWSIGDFLLLIRVGSGSMETW